MNINIKIEKETRNVSTDKKVIGNDGENLQGDFIFTFDDFVDGQAMLFYEIDGESRYDYLKKENETYVLPIKTTITKQGTIPMQLVIYENMKEDEVPIFKTNVFKVKVGRSIEDGIEQPEEYPSWLEIANTKLNEIDNLDISIKDGVVTITKKDGTIESENVKGEPNILTIGEVVTGDIANATITSESPNQILNLTLPKGDRGNGIIDITRYYLATDIGSFGGTKTIEWDGDTTNRETTQSYYKVSDEVLTPEELVAMATAEVTQEGNIVQVPIDWYMTIDEYGNSMFLYRVSNDDGVPLVLVVSTPTEELGVSQGTYFMCYRESGSSIMYMSKLIIPTNESVTTDTEGWTTEVQKTDSTNKYLWSYEVVTFDDGTTNTSAPVIIGTYGDKGEKGDTYTITDEDYQEIETNVKSDIQPILENIENVANQAELIARGKAQTKTFETEAELEEWLRDVSNKGVLKQGDNLYIKAIYTDATETKKQPDYWVTETLDVPNEKGYYYNISELGAETPVLTDYAKKEQFVTLLNEKEYEDLSTNGTVTREDGTTLIFNANTYYFILEEE